MGGKVILLVETDVTHAEVARGMLRSAGYATQAVQGVARAVEYLESRKDCGLVICSSHLPTQEGFRLLAKVKRNHPGVGVILMETGCDVGMVRKAFRMGAADVISGPLPGCKLAMENLLMSVAHGLEWVERQRQMGEYTTHLEQLAAKRATQLRTLRKDLEHWCEMTIAAMGELLDLRDEETEGHSKRVTAYASELALAMELRPAEIKTIVRGAYLHDIGKIAVPDAILRKPGRLTEEEMEIMRRHCEHGYGIVRKIPSLADAAEIVYTHQEAFDGGGYPRMLRGEEIPLGARIFAVADTLDAITSDRPYRRASSFDDAIEKIARCSGRQFDPQIVDTFLGLPKETWELLREDTEQAARAEGKESNGSAEARSVMPLAVYT
jgi:putative nucleotidyltransferase with HDIG domain